VYRLFRKKYAVPIGHGNSFFFWSWKGHGKSLLKKRGHLENNPFYAKISRIQGLSWTKGAIVSRATETTTC